MDKKKLSTGFSLGALVAAVVAIFMGFANFVYTAYEGDKETYKFFDYMFGKGVFKNVNLTYNAIYIVGFVLLILTILAIAAIVVMKFTGKGDAKLQKGLVIAAIIALFYVLLTAFLGKTIFIAEVRHFGTPEEYIEMYKQYTHLGAGTIVPGILGILGAGALVGTLVLDKKN